MERIRLYAHSDSVLWDQLSSICEGHKLDFSSFSQHIPLSIALHGDDSQLALQAPTEDAIKVHSVLPLDVQRIAGSGPPANRVDLTFFSDGYLASEQDKFIKDVTRLVSEISKNQTFHTVAPLLNFWAAFTPSNESGVGVGGIPKDTPFGLYRDGTELRGLYYARPEVARAACDSLGDRCDYPILIGNDPLYGGLGGEFTTITSSIMNGALILRHELGHSIIEVGEEYDGGFAYFGVNAAHNASEAIPWAHWLTRVNSSSGGLPRVERMVMPIQDYAWTLLNSTSAWSAYFNSSGTYSRYLIRFSLSGLPEKDDLSVLFDGEDLGWTPKEGLGVDRYFYDIYKNERLSEGEHKIEFVLKNAEREGIAQMCSIEVLEYGSEQEFIETPGFYGVFPTFSETNETTYRPTNEDCLMRLTTGPNFCKVCIEGLWYSLLSRVDPIDSLETDCRLDAETETWKRTLNVTLIPLGQFREDPPDARESYTIVWTQDGKELTRFANQTVVVVDDDEGLGEFGVGVRFVTEEVRSDPSGLLETSASVVVSSTCSESAVH
ncbi:hypothetical protein HETIRDRAFT_61336 [Heterobasidion irregulare TC 32-1]|uniref:IgA peptidase M64-domain-containing protein n=1 Tax=Heterobasidion irregulare (strain TC 32-1) TaxID=747525 RepID=W4K8R1_HETIT|nr:uncharacterized protein HETIRDRAFT_61336 [Heterobasidion irregulare TC 32-1]ETW82139.1 hypothetical protein HETIRDRAFT_61336 [Heterobasidion irregulare TC 32-1]